MGRGGGGRRCKEIILFVSLKQSSLRLKFAYPVFLKMHTTKNGFNQIDLLFWIKSGQSLDFLIK